jgi:hypothetical protein
MNYRDLILESYLEDQDDELDTYDSYDEEFDEYDYEDEDDDTSDYEDAYLEGYMYALAEESEASQRGISIDSDSYRRKERLEKCKAILADPKASKKEKEKAKIIMADITKRAIKTKSDYTTPLSSSEKAMKKFKSNGTKNSLGNQMTPGVGNTGAHAKKFNYGKAAAIGGAGVAGAAAVAGTAAAIKVDKQYKAYKAEGGKLSKSEWLKAGKPAPTKLEKLANKLPKKAVAEAYEDAYLETLDELGFFDFD